MGVEVSHDDVVITVVEKKVNSRLEIRMRIYYYLWILTGNIGDDGCYREVFGGGATGEEIGSQCEEGCNRSITVVMDRL